MTLVKWNPNRSIISDFDRIFDNMFNIDFPLYSKENSYYPPVDVDETEKEFILSADIPGLKKEKVSIDIHDGVITIKGERLNQDRKSFDSYGIHERQFGSFNRSFRLPDNVNEDKIAAKFESGELLITLPKTKEIKPEVKQIKIS
ncbi:Hsp20/alpha crystallin family protein [Candidatus Marinimicrobia bacterium]|nr:Hsp20/alpha crystallin family protein [Candidatus Neomarinimicrobiota bacterium]